MQINFEKFREKINEVFENYGNLKDLAKEKIIELANKEIENSKKKETVDNFVIDKLIALKERYSSNLILDIIFEILISNTSKMTQKIYDNLKEKIEGI